ncbi:MAG: 3-deoxy-D-manno-octulosonic acid transferase [Candidatus Brocadiae bacterium]|nr:3-deoxy-D-manno-octulosonic acid transferase [Candidatus Brocadiia bacterium]
MKIFWKILYNFFWHLVLPVWIVIQLFQRKKNKKSFMERLVLYPAPSWEKKPVIWFHGSSLGEVLSLWPFMKAMQTKLPHIQILSTQTSRGRYIAEEKCQVDALIYLPLDISYLVRKALKKFQPSMLILFETEIWPNLFWECERLSIPVVVVSGRISPRSFPRYRKARFFFKSVLQSAYFLMQSQEDLDRILAMGALPSKALVCGDIKLDGIRTSISEEDRKLCESILPGTRPTLVCGSTHTGEEAILIEVYSALKIKYPSLRFVFAPRHLDRVSEVTHLLQKQKIDYSLRTELPCTEQKSVIILNSYGELSKIYYKADWVFVGGTLVPVGGHNLMEPAALGKPVFFGENIANCKKQAQLLLEKNAGCIVSSGKELEEKLDFFLSHPQESLEMGTRGQNVVLANQGSMEKCLQEIFCNPQGIISLT